jgi:hypothetical protein
MQWNTAWGDQDTNEQGPGPRPVRLPLNREHTPLEYVWNTRTRWNPKAITDTAEHQ